MRKIHFIALILGLFLLAGCSNNVEKDSKVTVAVSIVPQADFVKAIGGDLVHVVTVIPPGSSPENYQPTPKVMNQVSEAEIYFAIGLSSEGVNILPGLEELNKSMKVIHLNEIVANTYPVRYFEDEDEDEDEDEHSHEGADPHIWMSLKRVHLMIEIITEELVVLDPENESVYRKNAESYLKEINALDNAIANTMAEVSNKNFIMMHPSMGYFADDYGLTMLAIEEDGKETTAKRLEEIIDLARDLDIKVIFYQAEFDSQQAKTLAGEIDGTVQVINVLSEDYLNTLEDIRKTFAQVLE